MEHIHITVAKYITIVGNAVELAGIMPEINKLNITIERRIVISRQQKNISNKEKNNSFFPYVV
jgi:C-terminal processing protease CtpA/Prc